MSSLLKYHFSEIPAELIPDAIAEMEAAAPEPEDELIDYWRFPALKIS